MFSYSAQQLFSKLEEMLLFELLDVICAFHFIGEATRLDCKAVEDLPITENAEPCAILLILFVAKFAVVILEVRRYIVQYHREALGDSVVVFILIDWGEAKDRILGRVSMDIKEHAKHVLALRHHLFEVGADKFYLC